MEKNQKIFSKNFFYWKKFRTFVLSAGKRIYGALLDSKAPLSKYEKIKNWIKNKMNGKDN